MPEDLNDRLDIYFTSMGKLNGLFEKISNKITPSGIIPNYSLFGTNEHDFIYCINETFETGTYDKTKLNIAEFVFIHDVCNINLEISKSFVAFYHQSTNPSIKIYLNNLCKTCLRESHHLENWPHYELVSQIVEFYKNKV